MNARITLNNLDDHVTLRSASVDDVPELLLIYEQFYDEAVYKDYLVWDGAKARDTILRGIASGARPHILAVIDDNIVGFIAYVFDHSFSTKPCQVLMELYVVPEHRMSAIGRALVGHAILDGQQEGAGAFHAPLASGMGATRSLINLLVKAGFEPMGVILRRGL